MTAEWRFVNSTLFPTMYIINRSNHHLWSIFVLKNNWTYKNHVGRIDKVLINGELQIHPTKLLEYSSHQDVLKATKDKNKKQIKEITKNEKIVLVSLTSATSQANGMQKRSINVEPEHLQRYLNAKVSFTHNNKFDASCYLKSTLALYQDEKYPQSHGEMWHGLEQVHWRQCIAGHANIITVFREIESRMECLKIKCVIRTWKSCTNYKSDDL